jgi:hypothetical protein
MSNDIMIGIKEMTKRESIANEIMQGNQRLSSHLPLLLEKGKSFIDCIRSLSIDNVIIY